MSQYEIDPNESDDAIIQKLKLIKQAEAQRAKDRQDINAIELAAAASAAIGPRMSVASERALCREVLRLRAELDELKHKLGRE